MEPNNSNNNQLVVFGENNNNVNQQENNQNPSNNTMRFVQYKKEVILNYDPNVFQNSLNNAFERYLQQYSSNQASLIQGNMFSYVGSQMDELYNKIGGCLNQFSSKMQDLDEKLSFLYTNSVNRQDFMQLQNNNNQKDYEEYNVKFNNIYEALKELRTGLNKVDDESKSKLNMLNNSSFKNKEEILNKVNQTLEELNKEIKKSQNKAYSKLEESINNLENEKVSKALLEKCESRITSLSRTIENLKLEIMSKDEINKKFKNLTSKFDELDSNKVIPEEGLNNNVYKNLLKKIKDLEDKYNNNIEEVFIKEIKNINLKIKELENKNLVLENNCFLNSEEKYKTELINLSKKIKEIENNKELDNKIINLSKKINEINAKNIEGSNQQYDEKLNVISKKINELEIKNKLEVNNNYSIVIDNLKNKVNALENKLVGIDEKNIILREGKVAKEYKDIDLIEFEKNSNEVIKKFKLVQDNNRLILKEITKNCEDEKKENEMADKEKVIFKKGSKEETIVYEISTLCKDWEFGRHMKNFYKRITKSYIKHKVNLRNLEKVYLMSWSGKQIQFTPQNATSNFIFSKNYFVLQGNTFVYVKNNRRRNYRKRFYYNKNKKKFFNNKNNKRFNNKNNNEENIFKSLASQLLKLSTSNKRYNNYKNNNFRRNNFKRNNFGKNNFKKNNNNSIGRRFFNGNYKNTFKRRRFNSNNNFRKFGNYNRFNKNQNF